MKHHPRQNVTLKIYSVSDDTASRLMTVLGKLLHSRRFIGKAERWKMFRSTPPKTVGHQMTYADRVRFQKAYAAVLECHRTGTMLSAEDSYTLGQLLNFRPAAPIHVTARDVDVFQSFIREWTGKDYPLADAVREAIRDGIRRAAPVRTNAIAGQNTRGLEMRKIPTWMVEHLQEAGDPGIEAYAKWLRGELLAPEEAHLLVMRGWISINDVRRNAGMLEAFAHGGEVKPGTFYVVGEHAEPCWVPPAPLPWTREYIETLNKKLAGKTIRRVERTAQGNLNFITDDADGYAVDTNIIQHHCGNDDYEHWRPMKPGERCSYCGWEYPLRVDVTTMSDDHRMRLNLSTGLIEKGEALVAPTKRWEVSRFGRLWIPAVSLSNPPSNPWEPDVWRRAKLRDGRTIAVKFWREVQ